MARGSRQSPPDNHYRPPHVRSQSHFNRPPPKRRNSGETGANYKVEDNPIYTRYGSGEYKCKICNVICLTKLHFNQHILGKRHLAAVRGNGAGAGAGNGAGVDAKTDYSKCEICQVSLNGPKQHEAHMKGLSHLKKAKDFVQSQEQQDKEPTSDKPVDVSVEDCSVDTSSEDIGHLQCNSLGCKEKFKEVEDLVQHVKEMHGFLITCTSCITMKWKPKECLTIFQLIEHVESDHKQKITQHDLKFYGNVTNWKQGYIKCKLCPEPELGKTGFWLTNEMDKGKIRQHFKECHTSYYNDFVPHISLGCQLCPAQRTGTEIKSWTSHLMTHADDQDQAETPAPVNKPSGSVVTSPCKYCGEKVVTSGNNEQTHIKEKHPHLSFSCKPCHGSGDRYLYYDVQHVLRHLKLKHTFKENEREKMVIYPGSKDELGALAWVQCKSCVYQGVGLGKETLSHSKIHGEGLVHFVIMCRICHPKYDPKSDFFDNQKEFEEHVFTYHKPIFDQLPET